jgi:hypothetical protein
MVTAAIASMAAAMRKVFFMLNSWFNRALRALGVHAVALPLLGEAAASVRS